MADWDLLLTDARIATMRQGEPDYGVIESGAIAIAGGVIDWIGAAAEVPGREAGETRSLEGRWVTPALVDCHTHLVFGGQRAEEYERRLRGASYEDIAAEGGGILSTVKATREASDEQLYADALPRLHALAREGVATVEIKSGYGLDLDNELKMLRVARRLGEHSGLTVRTSLLAAHTVAPEFAGDADAYMDRIVDEILPAAAREDLADAVDAYCESIAFDARQVERLFSRAQKFGLRVKLHADQLSDGGGAELAARFGALSADHLEYTSPEGVRALAEAGTAAVLLPGAYLTLNETQQPPMGELRESGVPLAIATDCNPGTSPLCSIHFAMGLGSRLFGMTPEECLAGVTREAARALGLGHDRGTLETGKRADIAIWDFDHPRELAYWLGTHPLSDLLIAGQSPRPIP
ncbi:MAG: imidazolonepropionase [Gammaproteobacteria bacterium]|jgi:imidazolonepropionase|nr:imidazolonepropionase [Gammaproteobacteria bacterium]